MRNVVATKPELECNLTSLESRHRIMFGHNWVAIVFRREPVVCVPGIAMKLAWYVQSECSAINAILM